jgi:hypothetical protein
MKDQHQLAMEQLARQATWMEKTGGYAKDMTLRDHFAVLAMQSFADEIAPHSDQEWFERITRGAYRMADAMLKERSK